MAVVKENYEISYIGDSSVENVHHISVDYNGYSYTLIFGRYVNGGFLSIPNFEVGCELSAHNNFDDVFWNAERIGNALKDNKAARVLAQAIKDYMQFLELQKERKED